MNDIEERFLTWAARNPLVVGLFFKFANEVWNSGRRLIGAKLIVERIRWEEMTRKDSNEDFKINNNYTAYLARMYIRKFPERRVLFKLRGIRT